ncbi:hypothetical protein GCM10010172_20500 [Paractinoplanes ferrugineus]|uniref:Uncharacterized protein n=1 Tax=Paractinoplanes ferrugineus TaxID=113564 RepID=A0A919IYH6_9ACTN|nr:hypothetical protein [Actinoplanes ferrugineus]GIE09039.1 hypothetical protein Afe05nite_08790 [Actinoplanes ferrugineus]
MTGGDETNPEPDAAETVVDAEAGTTVATIAIVDTTAVVVKIVTADRNPDLILMKYPPSGRTAFGARLDFEGSHHKYESQYSSPLSKQGGRSDSPDSHRLIEH